MKKKAVKKIVKNIEIDEVVIFPYEKINGKYVVIEDKKFKTLYPHTYDYLLNHKKELEKRSITEKTAWYAYGRNQSIQTVDKSKLIIKTFFKNKVKFHILPPNTLAYSNIVVTDTNPNVDNLNIMCHILESPAFGKYIEWKGKDYANNYKQITPKLLKKFKL